MKSLRTSEEIITALKNRDSIALTDIKQNYESLMRRVAINLGLNSRDTEECINDVLLETWNSIPPAKPNSIRSYVCMLMRRNVIDRIRYNSAEKRANTVYIEIVNEFEGCFDVEQAVIDSMCIPEILNQFLERQTPQNREIFIRRYYQFERTRKIAHDLLIKENTVDKKLSRMREELKQMLAEGGYC